MLRKLSLPLIPSLYWLMSKVDQLKTIERVIFADPVVHSI